MSSRKFSSAPGPYIPDRIRFTRTDRLVHIRDSHLLVIRRHLPCIWEDKTCYNLCNDRKHEISLIDAELHRRLMLHKKPVRDTINQRYQADRK